MSSTHEHRGRFGETHRLSRAAVGSRVAVRRGGELGERRTDTVFATCATVVAGQLALTSALASGTSDQLMRQPLWPAALLVPILVVLFARAKRTGRAAISFVLGVVSVSVGLAGGVPHAALSGPSAADWIAIAAVIAGLVMIGLSYGLVLGGRRLSRKLAVGVPLTLILAQWVFVPAINAGIAANSRHPTVPSARSLGLPGARDVSFNSADGTRLAGWYVPGRTGKVVVVLHGSHGTRLQTIAQLRMLNAAGYGVLSYDARGHGQSDGQANALGWSGARDLAAAVRFLRGQAGVKPSQIAALGLSMGAEEALRATAEGVPLAAVVADGAGASTQGDGELAGHGLAPIYDSVTWLTMRAVEATTGESEPPPLRNVLSRVRAPVLLIASGAKDEFAIDSAYARTIGTRASLWHLPRAAHTGGLASAPRAYTERVLSFLGAALAARR